MVLHVAEQHGVAGGEVRAPPLWATRFMASVALRVKMISRGEAAPMKRCTFARASSMACVAMSAMW